MGGELLIKERVVGGGVHPGLGHGRLGKRLHRRHGLNHNGRGLRLRLGQQLVSQGVGFLARSFSIGHEAAVFLLHGQQPGLQLGVLLFLHLELQVGEFFLHGLAARLHVGGLLLIGGPGFLHLPAQLVLRGGVCLEGRGVATRSEEHQQTGDKGEGCRFHGNA
ncbi:MAG TPA: hypothetical protein DIT64_07985 [Verrucomicrobiales bacterium]|nr:hypothetical protein [Verrucomicrobiales bacterium]